MATIAISAGALARAGVNVAVGFTTQIDNWIEAGEDFLSGLVQHDLVTNWGSISGGRIGNLAKEYCERLAAADAILYDMSGFTTSIEAENMITIHWARLIEIQRLLQNEDTQSFLGV